MKKKSILSLIIAMFLSSNIAFAQQSDKVYLTADEVPNAVYWLPACYARLHTCKPFLDDMAAAKKEFEKLSR